MEKLKEKNKHDHLFTKILKVSIFALVMLAPMFAVAAKVMYVTCNKNAKDSYSTQYQQVEENITNINDLQRDNTLYYIVRLNGQDYNVATQNYNTLSYTNPMVIGGNISTNYTNMFNNSTQMLLYTNNNERTIRLDYNQPQQSEFLYVRALSVELKCDTITLNDSAFQYWSVYLYRVYQIPYETLDNVFYSTVEQIGNEQIFSWTKNTGIYGAINTMTTGLGIDPTNNILAVLLTYWSLITAVYIIIDIIIEMFVRLTHLLA